MISVDDFLFYVDAAVDSKTTQGGALFHVYEELSQHLGQMEISRDLLVAAAVARDASP